MPQVARDVSLVEATIEAELLDSETGVRLGVLITQKGLRQVEELDVSESPASASELVTTLKRLGAAASSSFADLFEAKRE